MIHNTVIACRTHSLHQALLCSHVGVAFPDEKGHVRTFLLQHRDPNVAIEIARHNEQGNDISVFHVFAGLFVERVLKLQPPYWELFRFHRDTIQCSQDHDLIGDLVLEREIQNQRHIFSVELFQHLGLADPLVLADAFLTDRIEDFMVSTIFPLAPDPITYVLSPLELTHPGLEFDFNFGLGQYQNQRGAVSPHQYVM